MSYSHPSSLRKVLALDTSTDRLSVALGDPQAAAVLARYDGPGGAQASANLIPVVQQLLAQVGWRLAELDAIAFGCGPGAFTGLRTSCAVVQGLRGGSRHRQTLCPQCWGQMQGSLSGRPSFVLRHGVPSGRQTRAIQRQRVAHQARRHHHGGRCRPAIGELQLLRAGQPRGAHGLPMRKVIGRGGVGPFGHVEFVHARVQHRHHTLGQRRTGLQRPLARLFGHQQQGRHGQHRNAPGPRRQRQPLYVRDKVAQTTAEREQAKAAQQP